MKIIVTGGHLTPALATIDELLKHNVEIIFVGKPQGQNQSDDKREMDDRGIYFVELKTGRLHRYSYLRALGSLFWVPIGLINALRIVREIKPNAILSFGGYLSLPIVWAAWLYGIPSITHEQTRMAGIANRINSLVTKKVALGFEESKKFFPADKTIVIGNPIRFNVFDENTNIHTLEIKSPFIYITGGHQGAQVVNQVVFDHFEEIIKKVNIVHSVGVNEKLNNDWEYAKKLMKENSNKYIAKRYFSASEVGFAMRQSKLVISRSGANTCSEIGQLNKPCLLIPLQVGQSNEQLFNALLLKDLGLAEIIEQDELTGKNLVGKIDYMLANIEKYKASKEKIDKLFPRDSAVRLASLLLTLCKK